LEENVNAIKKRLEEYELALPQLPEEEQEQYRLQLDEVAEKHEDMQESFHKSKGRIQEMEVEKALLNHKMNASVSRDFFEAAAAADALKPQEEEYGDTEDDTLDDDEEYENVVYDEEDDAEDLEGHEGPSLYLVQLQSEFDNAKNNLERTQEKVSLIKTQLVEYEQSLPDLPEEQQQKIRQRLSLVSIKQQGMQENIQKSEGHLQQLEVKQAVIQHKLNPVEQIKLVQEELVKAMEGEGDAVAEKVEKAEAEKVEVEEVEAEKVEPAPVSAPAPPASPAVNQIKRVQKVAEEPQKVVKNEKKITQAYLAASRGTN
jgi:hypothetical protein